MGSDDGCVGWLIIGLVLGVILGLMLRDMASRRQTRETTFEKILFERDEQGRIIGFSKVNTG